MRASIIKALSDMPTEKHSHVRDEAFRHTLQDSFIQSKRTIINLQTVWLINKHMARIHTHAIIHEAMNHSEMWWLYLYSDTHTVFLWSRVWARVINAAFVKGVIYSVFSVCVRVSLRADVPGNAARLTGMVSWNEESWMKPNHTGSPSRRECAWVCLPGWWCYSDMRKPQSWMLHKI